MWHARSGALAASLAFAACVPSPTDSQATAEPNPPSPEVQPSAAPQPVAVKATERAAPTRSKPAPHFPSEFQLTSMRGTSHHPYLDGNTLDAVRAARVQGIEYIEIDLVLTNDGALVTAHQAYVEDCGTVSKLSLNQVRGCRVKGSLRLAELSQILQLDFKGVYLDLKDTREEDPARALEAVQQASSAVLAAKKREQAVLMVYDTPEEAVRLISNNQLRAGLKGYPESAEDTRRMVERASRASFELVCVNADYLDQELVEASAAQGVWHLPWSTDPSRAEHWRELAEAGVGGMIVLHFDLAEKAVAPHWVDVRSLAGRML